MKSLNVISWHYQTPERRALKRNRLGPPDVYPQDAKQEEDNLGADRLKKGYQVAVTSYEHESIVYNVKMPRLDRLDDTMLRGAQLVMQIMAKKMELNANLDKERKRTGNTITKDNIGSGGNNVGGGPQTLFQQFNHNVEKAKKSKERNDWFTDLAHGKPLAVLARKPPFFRKKEDALEYLCDYKVPVVRALWFLKLIAVGGQGCNKLASLFTKYVKLMLNQMSDSAKLESNIVYTDRWPHFVYICKHAYEHGMIEKQEFLMDLLDIFNDRFVQPIENRENDKTSVHPFLHNGSGLSSGINQSHYVTLFRLFLLFICQYTDQITQNIVLSKRCAFLVCHRLELYRDEAESREGRSVDCVELFDDMQQCIHQRAIILTLCGMLYAILIDCPAALIWNKYEVSPGRPPTMLHQLCGSPLDHLPCPFESLPLPPGHGTERLQEFIQLRLAEVRRRSRACENRWSLNYAQKKGFAAMVLQCLEIVGVLDSARLDQPNCIEKIYSVIFNGPSKESFEHEHAIRVKMLLQWAVTVEREGTHRAILVAQLLAFRINHRKTFKFGSLTLQEILLEFLVTEGPDPESTDKNRFCQEFSNLMLLFIELQRAGVFSHDFYVKELIRTGEMLEHIPLMQKIRKREEEKQKHHQQSTNTAALCSTFASQLSETTTAAVISGTTSASPLPLVTMPSESTDERPYLWKDLSIHERLLIHLPIPQSTEYRSECNQRSLLLYGIGAERDSVKLELRRLARELAKLWQKRIVVEFSFNKPLEIRFKKRATREQVQESMAKFRSCTYYDQLVLCGWCCESFIQTVQDFVDGHSCVLPTAEGLDIVLEMCELAQNIAGIMELAEELLPLLVLVERVLLERRVDCVPSNISAQLGYVLTAYISHNYYYFLYSQNAPNIVQGLYRVIESQLKSADSCLTGWGRTIAVFVLDAKKQLIETGLCNHKIEAKRELLKRVIPPWKPTHSTGDRNLCGVQRYAYNASTFKELLEEPKRIFSFNEYRRLHAVIDGTDDARYSFVVSALLAAVRGVGATVGNDNASIGSATITERVAGDRLVELANICGHVSAQAAQAEKYLDWCGALQALCCSSLQGGTSAFPDLLMEINVEDSTCHYNIATFYMLLAGRSCFSMNALVHQLLHTALKSLLNCGIGKVPDADAEAGVCLALLVLANIICQSDQPIILSSQYTGERINLNICKADRWILTEGHLHDVGDEVCALLVTICMIADYTKHKLRDRYSDESKPIDQRAFRREYIAELSKGVLMAMCEQEWVTQRIYRRCEDGAMDCFSSHQLRKNCLGQQLLRMALRRRSEREIVRELTICNGNSKKSLIDKLLNVLNIWNMRATYFDFKLMIREISPEGCTSKHAQQGAIAADALLGEIGKCCRDLFTQSHKSDKKLPPAAVGKAFRLKDITAYWLISPLVYACPRPGNLPASFPAITVQGKFLKEAASMLDTSSDNNKDRIQQSAWLLSQEPFLNLVLTCLNGEEQQRDGLVGSMLKQLQELALKAKDNPLLPYLRIFSLEREGVLLRISLVGGMFDSVCHTSICDTWALTLFQLMLYGVVSRERDGHLFDSCYDMLSTLLIWSITDPMNAAALNTQDPDTKFRFPTYSLIVKKLRKELNERALIPELRSLMQFLPIPKPQFELITCEPYGTVPISPQKLGKSQSQGQIIQTTIKANRHGLQFAEKVKLSAYDMIQYLNVDSTLLKRSWNWSMLQAVKLDLLPISVQRYIQRLVHHSHYNEFVRPTICGMDRPPNLDIYLSPPMMDVSETPATLHHVSSSATTSTTTSATSSTNIPVSSGGGAIDVGGALGPTPPSRAMGYQSSTTPNCATVPDVSAPSGAPGAPSATTMMFPGQGGPMPALSDLTGRGQNSSSPRGARGGRRKATGLSTRSQGTTRKQRQQRQQTVDQLAVAAAAAAAAAQQQQQQQMPGTVGCSGTGPPPQPTYPGTTWATAGPQQTVPQQFTSGPSAPPSTTGQPGAPMNAQTTEDSKMKIHSMILQKRQAQAASGATAAQQGPSAGGPQPTMQDVNTYQMSGGPTQYGGGMVMKLETGASSMQMTDHTQQQQQQQYAQQQQLIQMQQDSQGSSQYVVHHQQRGGVPYGQQSVQQAAYDSRFNQQQLSYGQQPQQQQYHPPQQY
uniref:Mediator complex subunit Med12 domain-containing protein n=1 Tax=Setaria digitata TaxID=48799 RepID=A0A915PR29_9BILA